MVLRPREQSSVQLVGDGAWDASLQEFRAEAVAPQDELMKKHAGEAMLVLVLDHRTAWFPEKALRHGEGDDGEDTAACWSCATTNPRLRAEAAQPELWRLEVQFDAGQPARRELRVLCEAERLAARFGWRRLYRAIASGRVGLVLPVALGPDSPVALAGMVVDNVTTEAILYPPWQVEDRGGPDRKPSPSRWWQRSFRRSSPEAH